MLTLENVIDEHLSFMADRPRRFSANTLRLRRIYLTQFQKYCDLQGVVDIGTVTNRFIDDYCAWYSKQITAKGTVVSGSTVNTSVRQVKAMFNWLKSYTEYSSKVIPADILEFKLAEKHPDVIVFSQVHKVVCEWANRQDCLMIATLFESGLRIEELVDFEIDDLRGRKLDVVGKGQKHRITFISEQTADSLRCFWSDMGWSCGPAFRPLMHASKGSGYNGTDTVRERIKTAFKKTCNLTMRPHHLRHAFALNLLENGCNLRSIQKLLGHSKIETTMKYLGITDKFLEKDYDSNFGGSVIVEKSTSAILT